MNRHEIETQLIEKASTDPAFRRRLLEEPKAAIADLLGVALPPGMSVTVLEEQPGEHYLVLPPAPPSVEALPLDDLDLALVGGGRTLRPASVPFCWVPPCGPNPRGTSSRSSKSSC